MKFYRGVEKLKKNLKSTGKFPGKVLSIPFIMGAIFSISKQPSFAMSQTFASSLQTSILSVTNNLMIEGTAATVSTLSASASKIVMAVVSSIAVAGGSIGTAYIINEANQDKGSNNEIVVEKNDEVKQEQKSSNDKVVEKNDEVKQEQDSSNDMAVDKNNKTIKDEADEDEVAREQACDLKTYTNASYPGFSFKYNECEWDISDVPFDSAYGVDRRKISLTKGNNQFLVELTPGVRGVGFAGCNNGSYEIFNTQNVIKGRFSEDNSSWMYIPYEMMNLDDYFDSLSSNIAEGEGVMPESERRDSMLKVWNFDPSLDGICMSAFATFTLTNVKNPSFGFNSEYVPALVTITYSGDNDYLKKADEVAKTIVINYNS
ncbi:MAG: hypothetical protein Kow0081_3200 [Candidatus Dojkabacteria bacterium]